jgi:hypothetical protein
MGLHVPASNACWCVSRSPGKAAVLMLMLMLVSIWTERATDPMMHEPNYAVNLELAELVNNKKANT